MKTARRRKGLPARKTPPKKIAEPTVIQDLYPDGIRDSVGRHVAISVPCWGCVHAVRKGDMVRCKGGITHLADIRTLSTVDPEVHGWPDSPGVRPMEEKDYSQGHRGRYFLTLETLILGGLDRPIFREVIARHVAAAWFEDGVVSSDERCRVAGDVRSEISKLEYLDSSILDELECFVKRLLGSEDLMDRPDLLLNHEGVERFGKAYDPLDRPLDRPLRDAQREKENWTSPRRYTRIHVRFVHNPRLHDAIIRLHGGRFASNGRVLTASRINRWGYKDNGWVTIRRFMESLPIPESNFVPHSDPGSLTEKTRCVVRRNRILCPIANQVPTATVTIRDTACAILKVKDPECLRALWRCLTSELRERGLASSKVPAEAKRYA